jgi:hypothetical protein
VLLGLGVALDLVDLARQVLRLLQQFVRRLRLRAELHLVFLVPGRLLARALCEQGLDPRHVVHALFEAGLRRQPCARFDLPLLALALGDLDALGAEVIQRDERHRMQHERQEDEGMPP